MSGGLEWMLRTVPDHHPTICAHRGDYIRVLRLIPGLVDLALVIDLLYDLELDLHLGLILCSTASMSSNLPLLFIIVGSV